jgi:TolA-binding protein
MEDRFENMERYFEGRMSDAEQADFEARRASDPGFDQEVRLFLEAQRQIKSQARNRMKAELTALGHREYAVDSVRSFMTLTLAKKYWYAVAASLLLVAGIGYTGYQRMLAFRSESRLAALYDKYYEAPDISMVTSRGSTDSVNMEWEQALALYNRQAYRQASGMLRHVTGNEGFDRKSAGFFYLGICYHEMNLPDSAQLFLNRVSTNSSLYPDARWYLGMSYLKSGKLQQADGVFKEILKQKAFGKEKEARRMHRTLRRAIQNNGGK